MPTPVTEQYAEILSKKRSKADAARVLEEFFQARLDEMESQVDDLLVGKQFTKDKKRAN
jgi:hypothetical protein